MRKVSPLTVILLIAVLVLAIVGFTAGTSADDDGDGGMKFGAKLSGAQEVSPPAPPGGVVTNATGQVTAKFDEAFTKVDVRLRGKNASTAFGAHFHCGKPGPNGPVVFGLFSPGPLSFDGKEAKGTLTNANFSGANCMPVIGRPVNNIAALAFAMERGLIYANVHTPVNPPGEIRGQLLPD